MSYLDRAASALAALDAAGLRRRVRETPPELRDFSSNDYLGLGRHPDVRAALAGAARVGSGGSRLLAGAHPEHRRLERELAALVGRDDALLFSSGYLAALGVVGALAPLAAEAYSDALNHASLIDALRLTRLERRIYPHRVPPALPARGGPALIVSETLFGMDGDAIDVAALAAGLGPGDVAILDEAHALGVLGPGGAGLAAGTDDPRIVVLGTLSKALGGLGGFVAGPAPALELLRNTARSFIFDTALPPALAAAASAAVGLVRGPEGDARRARLRALATRLRSATEAAGVPLAPGIGPVLSVVVGTPEAALAASAALERAGLRVPAIRPPTVPEGTARLRISLRADLEAGDVDALAAALPRALREAGVPA